MCRKTTYIFLILGLCFFFTPLRAATAKTVALFPVALYSPKPAPYLQQGLKTMFVSRLSEVGLNVITDDTFGPSLTQEEKAGKISRQRAEEIAKQAGADYAIFGSLTAIGKGYSLDLSLLDLTKSPPKVTRVSQAATEDEFIPRLADVANRFRDIIEGRHRSPAIAQGTGEVGQGPAAQKKKHDVFLNLGETGTGEREKGFFAPIAPGAGSFEATHRFSVRMQLMSLDVDDLDGDGNPEVALLGRKGLHLYTMVRDTLKLIDKLKGPKGIDLLKVSMGDTDGNGRPEIYVTEFHMTGVETTAYEWNNGFKKLFHKRGHFAAVKSPGRKRPYLLYQNSIPTVMFQGHIYIMGYDQNGNLVKKTKLPYILYPKFYTITPYDIDHNGVPEIIGLGQADSLHVWSMSGEVLYHENETIGGTNNAIDLDARTRGEPNQPRVPFNPRLVIADINGDGKKDLIAVKNNAIVGIFEHFLYYDSAYILGYRFKGVRLEPSWKTRKIPFCVNDIQVFNRTFFAGLQKFKLKNWSKGYSRVIWFDLPGDK